MSGRVNSKIKKLIPDSYAIAWARANKGPVYASAVAAGRVEMKKLKIKIWMGMSKEQRGQHRERFA